MDAGRVRGVELQGSEGSREQEGSEATCQVLLGPLGPAGLSQDEPVPQPCFGQLLP